MIEQVKKYAIGAYAAVVAILGAVIYYLLNKSSSLSSKNARLQGELSLREELHEMQEAKEKGEKSENDYMRTVSDFKRDNPGDGAGEDQS